MIVKKTFNLKDMRKSTPNATGNAPRTFILSAPGRQKQMLRHFSFLVFTMFISLAGFCGIGGVKTVGTGGDYQNLTQAFAAITSNSLSSNITLQLITGYPDVAEPAFPIVAPTRTAIGSFNVSVYPTVSGLSINGNSTTGILNLTNTKNITIDGRVNATGTTRDLVIYNDNATTGYVIQFDNESTGNTVTYSSVRGGSNVLTTGVIAFTATATSLGNSSNTISNCDIRDAGNGLPAVGIYSLGNTSFPNQLNTVTNSNVANFFNATTASQGISLGAGNTQWTITGNSLFQTGARTGTASATAICTGIFINNASGNNFTITDNFIGGSNFNCGGVTPWTVNGTGANNFFGISVTVGTTTASSIQNNTIKNFLMTGGHLANPIWAGIRAVTSGNVNIGTVTGNTIGSTSGTGSINVTSSTGGTAVFGISSSSTGVVVTSNNNIGSITINGISTAVSVNFEGIIYTAGVGLVVTNNLIGSTSTANSINAATVATSGSQLVRGIDIQNTVTGGNINIQIDTNIVANLTHNGNTIGANIRGIVYSAVAANGTVTIRNNQVYNISGAGFIPPTTTTQGAVAGIVNFGTGTNLNTISGNDIHSIYGTNTGAVQYNVVGIITSNVVASNILNNKIYDITNASTNTNATFPPVAAGILYGASGGAHTMANNMITLGNGQTNNVLFCGIVSAGNSGGTVPMYYNSIRIMGTATTGAYPSFGILRTSAFSSGSFGSQAGGTTVILRNNLIDNIRTGGTGKNYALGNVTTSGASGFSTTASNYNILNAPNSSQVVAWGTGSAGTDYSFAGFKTLSGGDAASITGATVTFLSPSTGDLHINMGIIGNQIESSGTVVSGFTTDYDNQTRPGPVGSIHGGGTLPDIGADEFDGVILDIAPPTISYTALNNTSLTGGETLTNFAIATDLNGINLTPGTRPRLYYKRTTDANSFLGNTSSTGGWKYDEANGVAGSPFTFTIDYTKLSGGSVSVGNIIQYFVVAQDNASTPNVGINSGTFANPQTTVALAANAFPIGGTINTYKIVPAYIGTINVGTGQTITSLSNTGGLFDVINNSAITGNVTVNITSDLTAETGTIGLNQIAEDGIGGYFFTIKPSGVARTVTGTPSTPSLIKLNGADRIIINGSLTGSSTDRSLTISNMSTDYDLGNISDNCVIHISSPNSTNPATFNTIKNCIVRGLSNVGTEYAICQGGSDAGGDPGSGALAPNSNNTYQNNLIFASNFGIYFNGSSANPDQNNVINANTIGSPVDVLKTYYAGFWSQGEVGMQITDNNILGVVGNLSGAFAISGIFINSASTNSVITGNNITDIKNTSTTGGAAGMRLGAFGSSTNVLVANNTISDIFAPGTTAALSEINNSYGIAVTSAQQANTYKFYYNSINLTTNQTSGISAAFFTAATVTTGASIDFRNNIMATAQTANTRYAMYIGSTNAIFSTINRNLYYTTPGGTLGFLTSARTTLAAWQTATGQDANSLNADPKFNTPIVLGPLPGSPVLLAGTPIAGITKDQIGITRSATVPAIGAYEKAGDYAAPVITYTKLPFTCGTGNVTLVANITDFSGVPLGGINRPRIFFKKNSGSYFSASGTQTGGVGVNGTWSFTINTTTLGGVTLGDAVSYFVIAQDVAPNVNVGTSPVGGFGSDVNAITAYPPAVDSFIIRTALAPATYTVGTGGTYTTLTSAINAYNTSCLSGPVVFSLLNGTYTTGTGETMPMTILENPYASATNTLTIKPASGVTSTITSATGNVFVMRGTDYVTIDGSNNGTSSRNLTLLSSSAGTGTRAIWLISLGAGKGATNNTIKNCTLQTGSKGTGANAATVSSLYGIVSSDANNGQGPDNDNLTITNNVFRLASIGVIAISNSTGILNNWSVTNNTFGDVSSPSTLSRTGFTIDNADNLTFTGNTFVNINTSDLGSATGISIGANVTNVIIRKNTFTDIKYSSTGSYGARAIDINSGVASANIVIDNNSISNVSGAGSNLFTGDAVAGIRVLGATGGLKIYYNSINLGSGTFAGNVNGILSSAIYFGATVTGVDLRNNILNSNLDNTGTANDKTYAIYSDAPSSAFTNINYNNYSTSGVGAGNLGFIGSNRTNLAGIIAGFGGNAKSTNVVPLFTTPTNLHLTATGNCGLDNKGQLIATYTTDLDGDTRSSTPDMGVDEFSSSDNQWIGTVSTNWQTAANWCTGLVPTATTDVIIPSGTSFQPVLTFDGSAKNLNLQTGATLGLSSFNLNVAGALSGTGVFVGGTLSKLTLSANGALGTLYLNAGGLLGSLTLSGTASSLTLGSALNIYTTLDVKGNTLATGNNLTIKSNVNGTGSVAPITTGGSITGNVTVERYIPANAFRAWRLLSVPVLGGQTFNSAWQEGQAAMANGNPGFGMLVTSIAPIGGTGYDAQTTGNSLLRFNTGAPGTFSAVSSTLTSMTTTSGYFTYIRGNRSASLTAGSFNPSSTTLRTKGALYTGDQASITLPAGQNVLVGNVYASAIDFALLVKSGITSFKVWDPKLAGTNNIGGYQTFSSTNGYDPTPGGGSYGSIPNSRIESGLAFFVSSGSGGSIQLTEASKITGSRNVFRTSNTLVQQFKTKLYATTKDGSELADGTSTVFDDAYSNEIDNADAVKVMNIGENLGLRNGSNTLAVEGRKQIEGEDAINYNITNLKQQQYSFEFIPQNMKADAVAYLEDKFDGSKTPVSLTENTIVKFTVTSDVATSASDRFRIIFNKNNAANIATLSLHAVPNGNSVNVNWEVSSAEKVKTYEVEQSIDASLFAKTTSVSASTEKKYGWIDQNVAQGSHYYRIKSIGVSGDTKYSDAVKININGLQKAITVYPNPVVNSNLTMKFVNQAEGKYTVNVVNKAGQILHSAVLSNNGNSTVNVKLPSAIAVGTYQLKIMMPDGKIQTQTLVIASK